MNFILKLIFFSLFFYFFYNSIIFSFPIELTKEEQLFLKKYRSFFKKDKHKNIVIIFPNSFYKFGFTKKESQILKNYTTSKDSNIITVDTFDSILLEQIEAMDVLVKRIEFCETEQKKNEKKNVSLFLKNFDKDFLIKNEDTLITIAAYFGIKNMEECERESNKDLMYAEKKVERILWDYTNQMKNKLKSLGWENKHATKEYIYFLEYYRRIFSKSMHSWDMFSTLSFQLEFKKAFHAQQFSPKIKKALKHPLFSAPFNPNQFIEAMRKKIEN